MADSSTLAVAPSAALSANARTWLSVAIFVHLFLVVIGVIARNEAYRSPFQENLRNVPGVAAYTGLLRLDPDPQTFVLTRGEPIDTDHFFELDLILRGGERTTATWPHPDEFSGQRFRRRERLAHAAAARGDSPEESYLPQVVARALCVELDAADGVSARHTVRLRWHALQQMAEVNSANPQERDPYSEGFYRTFYQADFKYIEGQVLPSKRPEAMEAAPAVRSAPRDPASSAN